MGVPASRDERLKKYAAKAVEPSIAAPGRVQKSASFLRTINTAKRPRPGVTSSLSIGSASSSALPSASEGGGFKRESKMQLVDDAALNEAMFAREKEEKRIAEEKERKREEKARADDERRHKIELKRQKAEDDKRRKSEDKRMNFLLTFKESRWKTRGGSLKNESRKTKFTRL